MQYLRSMLSNCRIGILAFACLASAHAADSPETVAASEASIRELMSVMKSRATFDGMMGQLDGMLKKTMAQATDGRKLSPEQQAIVDDYRVKSNELLRQQLDWESLQPALIAVYEKSFTQQDLDGMLAFYKSPAGQAVVAKMPLVTQNSMLMVQQRMGVMMPKLEALGQEMSTKLKAVQSK